MTIVAVNKSTSGYAQNFNLGNAEIADIDRWRTSGSENLAVTENLEYSGSSFYAQLPAQSVSTFVVTLAGGTVTQPTEPTVLNGTRIKNLVVSDTENAADWSIQNGFQDGAVIYGDRDITVQNVPAHLTGAEYIRTACDSKLVTTDEATFTAGQDSSIYVAMDDRITNPAPAWLSGWTKTAFTIQSSNGVNFEIYKKNVKSGDSITLGTNGGSGNSANYIVLATKQQDEPVVTQSIRGDINADGNIDARDLTLAKRLIPAKQYAVNADVNADGKVDKTDAELLMEYLLGKIKEFLKAVPVVDNAKMEQIFSGVTVGRSYKAANEGNSLITQYFGADPGVMVYNDRVYIYMTDDHLEYKNGGVSDNTYSQIKCLRCISSADLVNWTDHGLIPVAGQNGIAKWAGCSWAPTACHKTINGKEKFFLYFANNANGIGVLTADSPTGPWSDPNGKALISRSTPTCNTVAWVFDPAVLVDDDGTGYLYFGGGRLDGGDVSNPGTGRVVKLNPDMTSLAGDPVRFDIPYLFEDSGINKIGGKYVYSYCSNWSTGGNNLGMTSAAIEYMVSDNPMGPFTYGGEVFKNIGTFFGTVGNNHHTIFEFKNQYYLAYHSQMLQDLMGIKGGYRSTHLDVLPMNGSLPGQVKGTMTGVPQVGTLNPYETVRAATIWRQSGIEISGSGSTQVTGITSGDWFAVKGAEFSRGASQVTMKITSCTGGAVKICTGSENGTVVGYVEVPASSTNYTEVTAPVSGLSGKQDVYFIFSGTMNVESWSFT